MSCWDAVLAWADRAASWRWFNRVWALWALTCGVVVWAWQGNWQIAVYGAITGATMGTLFVLLSTEKTFRDIQRMNRRRKP